MFLTADCTTRKLDEEAVTYASEKVGVIYKFMLALLSYHHAYGPVTIAQEQAQSLAALLKVGGLSSLILELAELIGSLPNRKMFYPLALNYLIIIIITLSVTIYEKTTYFVFGTNRRSRKRNS